MDASKCTWSAVLIQEHTSVIDAKTLKYQVVVKSLSFNLGDAVITLHSDHLPLKDCFRKQH